MDFDANVANFDLYNIPIPSTHGEVSPPNTSLPEGRDVEMGPVDEECRPATTPGSQPLSPRPLALQPVSPRPISTPHPVQGPPSWPVSLTLSFMDSLPAISPPVSPIPSHLASPPGFAILPLASLVLPPLHCAPSVLPRCFSISPTPCHVSPPVQSILPTRHVSLPVQPTSPLPRHAQPISPAPAIIPPLSIFTKKRKSARTLDNPSKRTQSSTQTESTTTGQSGHVPMIPTPLPTRQVHQARATANSTPSNPPIASRSCCTHNQLSWASLSKNTPQLNPPAAHTSKKPSSTSPLKNLSPAWFLSLLHMLQVNEPPLGEVLSVPHRFLPDSGDSGGIWCILEEWKLAGGSANIAIPVVTRSGRIQAFQNSSWNVPWNALERNATGIILPECSLIFN